MAILDLTTFTEVDPNNRWSQTSTRCSGSGVTYPEISYVYKDYGAPIIHDFIHLIDINVTAYGGTTGTYYYGFWGVSTVLGASYTMSKYIRLYAGIPSGSQYYLRFEASGGAGSTGRYLNLSTTYYLKIQKVGSGNQSTLTCKIYPTSLDRTNNTNIIQTLSLTSYENVGYQYLYSGFSYGSGSATNHYIDAYSENFDIPDVPFDYWESLSLTDSIFVKPSVEYLNLADTLTVYEGNSSFIKNNHRGLISANETWRAIDNPHGISDNVYIADGVTLTIEEGCEIYFEGAYSLARYSSTGKINILGTKENPILISSAKTLSWYGGTPSSSDWNSIVSYNGICRYATIEYGGYSVGLDGFKEVTNSVFRYINGNSAVVSCGTSNITENISIENNIFYNIGTTYVSDTIEVTNNNNISIKHNLIYDSSTQGGWSGIRVGTTTGQAVVTNNTIFAKGAKNQLLIGLTTSGASGQIVCHNNILNNGNQAVWMNKYSGSVIDVDYNNYYNCTSTVVGGSDGGHSITSDPLLLEDYTIDMSSPCFGTGDSTYETYMGFGLVFEYITQDETVYLTDRCSQMDSQYETDSLSFTEDILLAYEEKSDIRNKINTWAIVFKNILNKFNSVYRVLANIGNKCSLAIALTKDFLNHIASKAITISNIDNDFRMSASFQRAVCGKFVSLGKTYVKVYINSIEQTDVDIDSISISKQLNSAHTANFNLGRAYDSSKPTLESEVEIKYHVWTLYKGYVTSITPTDSPESIQINCEDEYWKQNKTKKYFFVGHKPQDDKELYYYTINGALGDILTFPTDIGLFVPQTINCFGLGLSDATTSLITECGNYAWYYDVDNTKKLWTAGQGDIVNLERQSLNTNLGLYQIIAMQFRESVENLVNRFRVQLGERTIRRFNRTGGTKKYVSFQRAVNEIYPTPDWNDDYEVIVRSWQSSYGFNYPDPDKKEDYDRVFRNYKFPSIDRDTEEWSDRHEPTVEIENPTLTYKMTVEEGILKDGYTIDFENGTITFNEPIYCYKTNSHGEITEVRRPNIKVQLGLQYLYSHTSSSTENPETTVSNPMLFFTDKLGDYTDTITANLELTGFTAQQGGFYRDTDGVLIRIPSWDDTAFAIDYAYWQLSQTCDKKIQGTIDLTLDAICFYNINLSKRIMIDSVLESPLNISGITYNLGSFLVTLELENQRYYKRTVSYQSHGE